MTNELNLDELQCCVVGRAEHFIQEPKLLACKHFICAKCVQFNEDLLGSECRYCNSYSHFNESEQQDDSIDGITQSIEFQMQQLAEVVYAKLGNVYSNIKDEIQDLNVKIETQVEFIAEEIEIQIESLKSKLDDIWMSFRKRINETKDKMKEYIVKPVKIEELEKDLKKFNEEIQNNSIDKDLFYAFNTKYVDLCTEIERIKSFDFTVYFNANENLNIDEDSIGLFRCNYASFIDKFESAHPEFISFLRARPLQLIRLNDRFVLNIDRVSRFITIVNDNFQALKIIEKEAWDITSDSADNLYILVENGLAIDKLDSSFSTLKTMIHPEKRRLNDLFFYNNKLYGSTGASCIIDVFDVELKLVESHRLNVNVIEIKILHGVACVRYPDGSRMRICFYKLPTFEKLGSYNQEGPVLAYGRWFIFYDKCFYIYNQSGNFVKKIKKDIEERGLTFTNMATIDKNLIIYGERGKVIRIRLN